MAMKFLFNSRGEHIANLVSRQLHSPSGENVGHYLPEESVFIDMSGRYLEKALAFCVTNSLFSAVEFRNATEYFEARLEKELEQVAELPKVTLLKPVAATKKRDLSAYEQVVKGGDSS
jgi:hypothetical protein